MKTYLIVDYKRVSIDRKDKNYCNFIFSKGWGVVGDAIMLCGKVSWQKYYVPHYSKGNMRNFM
jgi:hypothetical protein